MYTEKTKLDTEKFLAIDNEWCRWSLIFWFFHDGKDLNHITRQDQDWSQREPPKIEDFITKHVGIVRPASDHQKEAY